MTWRIIYLSITGLVLAAIVHLLIILLIPTYGTRDAWAFLSGRTDLFTFSQLRQLETGSAISEVDPFFTYGVCRFDLAQGGLRMNGSYTSTFWSASVFDDNGTVIYSLNNRTAINNTLDLLLVNPLQTLELKEAQPDDIDESVVIEASVNKGFVVIRVLQPDDSWTPDSKAFLDNIKCEKFVLPI